MDSDGAAGTSRLVAAATRAGAGAPAAPVGTAPAAPAGTVPRSWLARAPGSPGPEGRAPAWAARFRRLARVDWTLVVPGALTLALGLWGLGAAPYWSDEFDSVSAASRTLPQMARLLGRIDAVHGLYYLLLWPVVRVAGTGEFATRMPSAVAMAAAAVGVSAIAARLRTRRAGLCAGLIFALLPSVSGQAHNARPYAMVIASVVLASYLFIRAVADPRPVWWANYGLALVLVGYMQMFALLIVAAHAVTLVGAAHSGRRARPAWRLFRAWLVTVTLSLTAVAPLIYLGWEQRAQISWIKPPTWASVTSLMNYFGAGAALTLLFTLLAVAGARHGDARHGALLGPPVGPGRHGMTWLALPWLVLPPALLLTASEFTPLYNSRYVSFCLPAVALLAGLGLAALATPAAGAALLLIVALTVSSQIGMRATAGGVRSAAEVLQTYARPGDAIVYPGQGIPPWYLAYPTGYGRPHQIGMAASGAESGRLFGVPLPAPEQVAREAGFRRVWLAETGAPWAPTAAYIGPGLRLVHEWVEDAGTARIWLYQREGPAGPAGATAKDGNNTASGATSGGR